MQAIALGNEFHAEPKASLAGAVARDKSATFTINGRFLSQRVTGVQRYAREVVANIDAQLVDTNARAVICAPEIAGADKFADMEFKALKHAGPSRGRGVVWEQLSLPQHRQGPLLNLCNMAPIAVQNQVVCLHDLNTFLNPESYSASFRLFYRLMTPLIARRAARITTVSNFSARMIEHHLGVKRSDIRVLGNGHEHVLRWDASASSIFDVHPARRPYVLLIAHSAKHKNVGFILGLADALDNLGVDVWVAGASSGIYSAIDDKTAPNVKRLGYVSDDDLAALYSNAMCLAFPSLTEGFGIPLVEAMALRCPIVASTRASMPEVCGDAALLADPEDAGAWIAHFTELARSSSLRSELVDKGARRVLDFSWVETAKGYRDMLLEMAS
jgi:glycosyltransferase involved in cell wall biosynthesis